MQKISQTLDISHQWWLLTLWNVNQEIPGRHMFTVGIMFAKALRLNMFCGEKISSCWNCHAHMYLRLCRRIKRVSTRNMQGHSRCDEKHTKLPCKCRQQAIMPSTSPTSCRLNCCIGCRCLWLGCRFCYSCCWCCHCFWCCFCLCCCWGCSRGFDSCWSYRGFYWRWSCVNCCYWRNFCLAVERIRCW